jgi:hypothetical protein
MLTFVATLAFGAAMVVVGLAGMAGIAFVFVTIFDAFLPDKWKAENIIRYRHEEEILAKHRERARAVAAQREKEKIESLRRTAAEAIAEALSKRAIDDRPYEQTFEEAAPKPVEVLEEFEIEIQEELMGVCEDIQVLTVQSETGPEVPKQVVICVDPLHSPSYLAGITRANGGRIVWTPRKSSAHVFRNGEAELKAHIGYLERQGVLAFVVAVRPYQDNAFRAKGATA